VPVRVTVEGGSVIPFEKEFVEVGDEEPARALYSQDDLDGCEPGSSGLAIVANKVSTKGHTWEIIMMNAMRLTCRTMSTVPVAASAVGIAVQSAWSVPGGVAHAHGRRTRRQAGLRAVVLV
jgi:hypothetical protein